MPRISPPSESALPATTKQAFAALEKQLGSVPNIVRTMAASPAAVEAYLAFGSALTKGTLSAKLREQIALIVAQTNGCGYCLAAHTALGERTGLSEEEIIESRHGRSNDPKSRAALLFAGKVVADRGRVDDDDVAQLRKAGFDDGEIAEIVAHIALNLFTNYFNHIVETEVDFPQAAALGAPTQCVS